MNRGTVLGAFAVFALSKEEEILSAEILVKIKTD
jgi:hypothetical protein